MKGSTNESVGENFQKDLLHTARNKTLDVILETSKLIKPGMSENEAKLLIKNALAQVGAPKSWHPPKVRFGENTLLSFSETGKEDVILANNDIYFFDLGSIFDGHEGDVGRPFYVGNDPEMKRCCLDCEKIWNDVRDYWKKTQASGVQLYEFAKKQARSYGWVLSIEKANGHRIADFPHAARIRGNIEEFQQSPTPDRWILEIQIRHPERPFGAFYEDLLT